VYKIVFYDPGHESQWDNFIHNDSVNGTFLQSRNFLNYHPKERFVDSSVLLFKKNVLAAVVPGCSVDDGGKKTFFSHAGSTFGGLVVHKKYYDALSVIEMIKTLENGIKEKGFEKIILKITPDLFCKENSDVLQYALAYCGYSNYSELSAYIDFNDYDKDITNNFNRAQRKRLNQALKNNMKFEILKSDKEICDFHDILQKNLIKYNAKPIHTAEELLDFKNYRLKELVEFCGVFYDDKMIAGGMMFKMGDIIHAQNLNGDSDYLQYNSMPYLYYCAINHALQKGYKILSWGISTEKRGSVLNESLLSFKESFGSKYSLNRGFYKTF
jgi:hypothetical protein